jgi:hypothetical protein
MKSTENLNSKRAGVAVDALVRPFHLAWKALRGDLWRVDKESDGSYGIYHPWRWHSWGHGMSHQKAKAEVRRMNDLPSSQQPGIHEPNDTNNTAGSDCPGATCSHSSRRTPRDLIVVLDQILEIIPLEEMEIRRSLYLHHSANRYRAHEVQDWHGVAATLQLHCEGRHEPWIEESLRVWRDDVNV